jgi:hypothetical protein
MSRHRRRKFAGPTDEELFPGCSEDEIAIGRDMLGRIVDVIEGRVDARSARDVLGAAAYLLSELCLDPWREADQ